ncbi:pyridoxamine 5'-phosphate oxidase family protein [Emticicia sp. C21]|uniref:pyridoxamine 5'-phosphate oxidase family protein n=1 Tax=Emticicia sp. C21 TaxID=2302915 RepID=UPI001E616777|nr:pyridoxamine 5'-phosphate oxidase family protein [Emticicia sp. C21]
MASITESGFPYIQHRGGPKGFLKVLDAKRIGFIDFAGNKQYVSVGNFETNRNVSLFLMDYVHKIRLKIFARVEVVELEEDSELYKKLDIKDYKFRPERMMVFHVESFDWNCPQHITPRYTVEEIELMMKPQREYIAQLEAEIERLKATTNT